MKHKAGKKAHKPNAADSAPVSLRPVYFALLLSALCLMAYAPVFNADFIWDDDLFISENKTLHTVEGLKTIWLSPMENPQYYPLLLTVFWIQYQFFGVDPAGYHAVTLFFHIATAIGFWLLARRLAPSGAGWAALIFALHPLNVQSVAWATELKNTLSGFFYVMALWSWDRFLVEGQPGARRPGTGRYYWGALAGFIAAVLSKTPSYSWVLFAFLIGLYHPETRARWRWLAFRLIPMIIFGAFVGWISVRVEHSGFGRGHPFVLSPAEQWVSAGKSLWYYLRKLVWPDVFMVVYPRWSINPANPLEWFPWLAALLVMALLWLKRKAWTWGPFLCGIFYIIAVAPIQFRALGINFIYLYSFIADHFAYLPLLAILMPIGVVLDSTLKWLSPFAGRLVAALLVGGMVVLTWQHAKTFQSKEAKWSHNARHFPESGIVWMNLGYALSLRGAHDDEIKAYERVLALDPGFIAAYNDMGLAYAAKGDLDAAKNWFEKAIERDPSLHEARLNLGNVMARQGSWRDAIPLFEEVLLHQPDHLVARLNLAHALRLEGRLEEAAMTAQIAMTQEPDAAAVWYEHGMILAARGQRDAAKKAIEKALSIAPDYEDALAALRELIR